MSGHGWVGARLIFARLRRGSSQQSVDERLEGDHRRIHQDFAGMLEIGGDPCADDRLHLSGAPFGMLRMADPGARLEQRGAGEAQARSVRGRCPRLLPRAISRGTIR